MNPLIIEVAKKVQDILDTTDSNTVVEEMMEVEYIMKNYDLNEKDANLVLDQINFSA